MGKVKETIMQVSMSKKWDSKPALDEKGLPLLTKSGKRSFGSPTLFYRMTSSKLCVLPGIRMWSEESVVALRNI